MSYDGTLKFNTSIDESGFNTGISSIGSIAKTGLSAVTATFAAVTTAAATAVIAIGTAAISAYAEYEQLVGGVETLFDESSDKVLEYANNAYKTAGLSANEYMTTVTSFSASLLQSLGNDTEAAAEKADMAITDMSDNANKMGSNMEDIQNAYQGFAKANYTMLDNLKLGYGGTTTEMERLLADAEAISGIEYDISSYADIVDAIHVIQTEMGITGTTAEEASTTIQGSISSMSAAWTNMLTGLTDESQDFDQLLSNLFDSIVTVGENLIPRMSVVLSGITQLITTLAPQILELIPSLIDDIFASIAESTDTQSISVIGGLFADIISLLLSYMPQILEAGVEVFSGFINGFIDNWDVIASAGMEVINGIISGITSAIPDLIPAAFETIVSFAQDIVDNLPAIVDTGIDIILAIVEGIINCLPTLIEQVPVLINTFTDTLYGLLPTILMAGVQIIVMLGQGIIDSIPLIMENAGEIVKAILNVISLLNLASTGKSIITSLGTGIKDKISVIKTIITDLISSIKNYFSSTKWSAIGTAIMAGIAAGINGGISTIVNAAKSAAESALNAAKSFLGIASPSKVFKNEVGLQMAAGVGIGFEENLPIDDMDGALSDSISAMSDTASGVTSTPIASTDSISAQVDSINTPEDDDPNNDDGGTTVIPVYIGNEKIDEIVVKSKKRVNSKSGGYANA